MDVPLKKTTFPPEFQNYFHFTCTYTNYNHIPATTKKSKLCRPTVSKWQPMAEFFNKIWLKVAEHEYIFIFEIKFLKIILFKNDGQNKVCDIEQ